MSKARENAPLLIFVRNEDVHLVDICRVSVRDEQVHFANMLQVLYLEEGDVEAFAQSVRISDLLLRHSRHELRQIFATRRVA